MQQRFPDNALKGGPPTNIRPALECCNNDALCQACQHRPKTHIVMIEAIMFLKTNRLFWDSKLVAREAHAEDRENQRIL
ncbi:hypothetical protein F441_04193 [Phytophthora nicotianae CJ01A1]|uniref:Uncharacterized protein n=6 Tax=Phytophthora nicotianae TaxID=4792 RepID=W2QJU8_PHYN3|nr:hypothetical protein PPTG_22353 [Phytophthora nicotianae INRA-310]ETI52695.1 hypothetical protein F443_04246 [Phytophthora nicotianae P1569]ETK92584.1 hypothetical protein L915_04106 [Phytophthora nicotianae]ETO81393.1 hypothetical protein F444_04298 [Phytophthora nicotianae P1976]ETP22549.1 hypothetical protein F441_04193 [Phytophthora nicotianae CJ01A1]ETP50511.1 hypothetical protein F442_04212 [Phytophthora nicotianae P10297]